VAGRAEILPEYVLGFGFGWMVFQALFMRGIAAVKNYQAEIRRDVEPLSARAKATRAQQRGRTTHRCQKNSRKRLAADNVEQMKCPRTAEPRGGSGLRKP